MKKQKLDIYLQHFLAESMEDIKTIKALNEAETIKTSKYVLDNMITFVMKKTTALDYDAIEMTKGNIKKLPEYETLRGTIKALQSMKRDLNIKCTDCDEVENALNNVESLTGNFEVGFRTNNATIKLLYNNIVVAIICSTSFLIATHVEFIKTPSLDYKAVFKKAHTMSNGYNNLFLKNLAQFNRKCASGEIQKFITLSMDKRSFMGVSLAVAGSVVLVGISCIPLIREIIYQYYNLRVSLSDYLRVQADFLAINQNNLLPGSKEAKKQQEMINRLLKWSDKVDVDLKVSTKKAVGEIVEENKTLSLDVPSNSVDDSNENINNSLLI